MLTTLEARWLEEARYNLATRVMSNGVEVIVAGDKSTLPGEPDVKRILPSSIYKPVTLKPSTLSDHMMMQLPQESSNIDIFPSSLYQNQFVTKTCLTTFTFLTTFVENGTTAVSSRKQVISNIATEERNTGKISPTSSTGITLTQHPNLSVGIFPTTYTYFNTIMDGEQPLVVQSKHTITNTVTAADDYLFLLQPSEQASAVKDTNTYYSTVTLQKTLRENDVTKIVSTEEVVTQVVITESIPPKATSVMTSYIALDVEDPEPSQEELTTTDVVKTYFITYTYYNTVADNGQSYIQTNISTSTDVVTEKIYLQPKRTSIKSKIISTAPIEDLNNQNDKDIEILATKTYLTTFTSRTTMLSEKPNGEEATVVSSRFRIVENVVTETVDSSILEKSFLSSVKKEIKDGDTLTKIATINGQQLEIVFVAKEKIKPTSVLPIVKTQMPELTKKSDVIQPSNPSIITGSTIVFVDEDDDPFKLAASEPTPIIVSSKIIKTTALKNNLNSLLSSEIVTKASKNSKRHTNKETLTASKPTSTTSSKIIVNKDPPKKKPGNKVSRPANPVSDLLGLSSLNINRLTPVLNVMADLLQNNLKKPKKNETVSSTIKPAVRLPENIKPKIPAKTPPPTTDSQNRPIYIPVGGFTDIEVAESQNIATFQINEQIPWSNAKHEALIGKLKHESPLLNGGIPISPGEIITANSDVIVGKPGRVGPRIPAIPLHDVSKSDEIPIGMKPPPLVPKNDVPKQPYDKKPIPIRHDKPPVHPILHAPNKDDYVGPPPPPVTQENKHRNEDYIPLLPPLPNDFEHSYNIPIITLPDPIPNESLQIHNQYHQVPVILGTPINEFNIQPSVLNEPIVLPEVIERSTGQPLLVNIQPSQVAFVNIPHNRTTALIYGGSTEPHRNGQYFDDPSPYPEPEFSGIENYNDGIPQIASIYNQKHYHGQDHQQVGGVIKVDSRPIVVNPNINKVHSGNSINIRPSRPMDVVNVQNVKINAPPISFGSMQKDNDFDGYIIQHQSHDSNFDNKRPALSIGPSSRIPGESSGIRIKSPSGIAVGSHTEVTLGMPSGISIGSHSIVSQQEKNYLGVNVRNTNNLVSFPSSFSSVNTTANNIFNDNSNYNGQININQQKVTNHNVRIQNPSPINMEVLKPPKRPSQKESNNHGRPSHDYRKPYPQPRPTKRPHRPMPNPGIADYMTPPPLQVTELFQDPNIPEVFNVHSVAHGVVPHKRKPMLPTNENSRPLNNNANAINGLYNIHNHNKYQNFNAFVDTNEDLDGDDFDDHNGEMNDAGEVIQESNTRPLRPGQIPIEIQRIRNLTTTTTTPKSTHKFTTFINNVGNVQSPNQHRIGSQSKNQSNNFSNNFDNEILHKPIIQKPRPFSIPHTPSKKQHNNHIISYGHDKIDNNPQNRPTTTSKPKVTTDTTPESNRIQVIWSTSNYTITPFEEIKSRPATTPKVPIKPSKATPTVGTSTIKTVALDKNTISKDELNKTNLHKIERPKFTSLPIDVHSSTRKPITNYFSGEMKNVGTQTEKPFKDIFPKQDYISEKPVLNFNNDDVITTSHRHRVTTPRSPTTTPGKLNLNIGEVPLKYLVNKTVISISDMEILKPPPPTLNNIIKEPSTEMQPPKTNINLGGRVDIYKINTVSTPLPYIPKPSEEMMPPPITTEVVIGMNPPAVTTHRPLYRPKLPSVKPVYSLKLDPPRTTLKYETSTYSTTTRQATRTRRPYTRKPTGYRSTTTRSTTVRFENPVTSNNNRITSKPVTSNKPVHIWYADKESKPTVHQSYNRTRLPYNISTSTEIPSKSTVNTTFKHPTDIPPKNNNNEIRDNQSDDTQTAIEHIERPVVSVELNKFSIEGSNEISRNSIQPSYIPESTTSIDSVKSVTSHGSLLSPTLQLEPTPTRSVPQETDEIDIITKGTDMMDMHVLYNIGNTKDVSFRIEPSITSSQTTPLKPTKILEETPSLSVKQKTTNVINTVPSLIANRFGENSHSSRDEVTFTGDIQNTQLSNNVKKPNRTVINKIISIKPVSTKYITYTTTSTVTITETSVVTESGAPASTYTTVITKTEKITMVDTITEVTTLLQPTNIVETITTTVNHFHHTLYGSGTNYDNIRPSIISPSLDTMKYSEDDLIITETEAPIHNEVDHDNDSILVVLTDKNSGGVYHKEDKETQVIDEIIDNNEADKILLGGISIASVPGFESPMFGGRDRCNPECRASKNELCQKIEGIMRCTCRPGFARMFPDHPCKPTYTYTMKISLDKYGKEKLYYKDKLADQNSTEYMRLMAITQEALDRMVMQSDLRDIYHGVTINGFERDDENANTLLNNFNLQLSDNTEETRLTDIFKRYLRNNNFSLGGTELYSSPETINRLEAEDFNECSDPLYHDCSEHAHCFNLRGTYTCSCKEGYADLSENILYPGRICSAEIIGCELCNYHGTCYNRGEDQVICECFQWYAGHSCHINLKVLLIALVTLGTILFTLLLVCVILTCCRRKPRHPGMTNGLSFLPQRVSSHGNRRGGTLDRRAMIQDTSSESGQSETNTISYVQKKPKKLKGALKKPKPKSITLDTENETNTLSMPDQKDRSLTVMIPRAKYHPAPPTSPITNLTSFDKRKTSATSSNEAKLLSYLDAGPSPDKIIPRKYSSAHSESYIEEKPLSRKTSGALISAGFEVSATVMGNNMGTLGTIATTCGTEADRSENATLIQKISADLLSNTTGTRSQFNTLRNALIDEDVMEDPMANWMDTRITTVSEARSYDETTIQLPTKSFRNDYDSKPSSQHPNDEANTMAERDLGSTFLLPHTHLYKPDRGSDISGFESL